MRLCSPTSNDATTRACWSGRLDATLSPSCISACTTPYHTESPRSPLPTLVKFAPLHTTPMLFPNSAITKAFGGSPVLSCSSGELTVVGLCLDKNLGAIDCPSNLGGSCSSSFTFPSA